MYNKMVAENQEDGICEMIHQLGNPETTRIAIDLLIGIRFQVNKLEHGLSLISLLGKIITMVDDKMKSCMFVARTCINQMSIDHYDQLLKVFFQTYGSSPSCDKLWLPPLPKWDLRRCDAKVFKSDLQQFIKKAVSDRENKNHLHQLVDVVVWGSILNTRLLLINLISDFVAYGPDGLTVLCQVFDLLPSLCSVQMRASANNYSISVLQMTILVLINADGSVENIAKYVALVSSLTNSFESEPPIIDATRFFKMILSQKFVPIEEGVRIHLIDGLLSADYINFNWKFDRSVGDDKSLSGAMLLLTLLNKVMNGCEHYWSTIEAMAKHFHKRSYLLSDDVICQFVRHLSDKKENVRKRCMEIWNGFK